MIAPFSTLASSSRSVTPTSSSHVKHHRPTNSITAGQQHPSHSGTNSPAFRHEDLEDEIESWVETLCSPLSTSTERIEVLNTIEKSLVSYAGPTRSSSSRMRSTVPSGLIGLDPAATFWALQGVAGYNLAEVLLSLIFRLHLDLIREDQSLRAATTAASSGTRKTSSSQSSTSQYGTTGGSNAGLGLGLDLGSPRSSSMEPSLSPQQRQRLQQTVTETCIAITILQGLTLCNSATSRIMQRKSSLELLLSVVLGEYCIGVLPPLLVQQCSAPNTPTTPTFDPATDPALSLPSGFALDLLMCVLVDNQTARDRFEDMGGIQQIVQLSHKCADSVTNAPSSSTSHHVMTNQHSREVIMALKQTDLLCLEFRYFWSQLLKATAANGPASDPLLAAATSSRTPTSRRNTQTSPESDAASIYIDAVSQPSTPRAHAKAPVDAFDLKTTASENVNDTPKATHRRVTAPLASTISEHGLATMAEQTRSSGQPGRSSPSKQPLSRRLRQSASTAELRSKAATDTAILSKVSRQAQTPPEMSSSRGEHSGQIARVAISSSTSALVEQRRGKESRRNSKAESGGSGQLDDQAGSAFKMPRIPLGMSSRERPRIPSPLKPRSLVSPRPATSSGSGSGSGGTGMPFASTSTQTQMAPGYRRLRAATSASVQAPASSASASAGISPLSPHFTMEKDMEDRENRNPFARTPATLSSQSAKPVSLRNDDGRPSSTSALGSRHSHPSCGSNPEQTVEPVTPTDRMPTSPGKTGLEMAKQTPRSKLGMSDSINSLETSSGLPTTSSSVSTLGVGVGVGVGSQIRIPPSPAVRRAQLARARSLSPSKLGLGVTTHGSVGVNE
ncbi:hypothetical protein BCV70DRAFT_101874 [Testicularia cyperi]|uniref:Don3 interacting protein n=1 Tax=Testicularia cyperi TaxID=1882483 RepID=A0A317XFC9_9BASI|nr:hypothetical protein BCV70DRAFT_101874 [Testicularia cyperi]